MIHHHDPYHPGQDPNVGQFGVVTSVVDGAWGHRASFKTSEGRSISAGIHELRHVEEPPPEPEPEPTAPTSIPAIIEKGVTYANPASLGFEIFGHRYHAGADIHNATHLSSLPGGFGNCVICGRGLAGESEAKWVAVDSANAGFVAVSCSPHRASLDNCHPVGHTCHKKLTKALAALDLCLL